MTTFGAMEPRRTKNAASGGRVAVERVAEEYLLRRRRGEGPTIEEYVRRYPELAEEIRALFPTLAMLEDCATVGTERPACTPSGGELPGAELLGEYRIVRELGRGGMGVVYEAEHRNLRRRVALKILPRDMAANQAHLQRFLLEARAAGQLHHSNIVPVFDVGVHDGLYFYAMQYIHGQNLGTVIEELRHLRCSEDPTVALEPANQVDRAADSRAQLRHTVAGQLLTGEVRQSSNEARSTDPAHVTRAGWREEAWLEVPDDGHASRGEMVPPPRPTASEAPRGADSVGPRQAAADATVRISADVSCVGEPRETYFQRVARMGLQVAEALDYAHRHGVLHRDIKPSNLILDTSGTVWVTDFGLAKHEGDNFTHSGDIVGTLRYMAPERLQGRADARSDLYSLGLTLYELCTLQPALSAGDRVGLLRQIEAEQPPQPRRLVPKIPRDLETIILKAIDKSPAHRYGSAAELVEDLRLFLADHPILARRSSWSERTWRWCRRNPVLATLASCVAVLLLTVVAGSLAFGLFSVRQAVLLARETRKAVGAQREAEAARGEAIRRLYESCLGQARAGRWSSRPGQHFDTLASLQQAAEILPALGLGDDEERQRRLVLRNEAIAALALVDLRDFRRWKVPAEANALVALPPDYSIYAISDRQGNITVRHVADDSEIARLPGPGERAWFLTFSPDGRYLAGKFHRGTPSPTRPMVRVWDLTSREVVIRVDGAPGLGRMAFRGDSAEFALDMDNREVRVYELPSGKLAASHQGSADPSDLAYDPTGSRIAITYPGAGSVEIWNRDSDTSQPFKAAPDLHAVAWSPDGRLLAMGSYAGAIYLHDMQQPNRPPRKLEGHLGNVVQLAFNHRGDLLLSRSWDSTARIWQVANGLAALRHEVLPLSGTGFRRDDRQLAFSINDGGFGLWDISDGGPLRILATEGGTQARSGVRWHPRRPDLLVSTTEKGVEIWDAHAARRVRLLDAPRAMAAVFSPDGRSLFTSGASGLQLWPIEDSSVPLDQLRIGLPETLLPTDTERFELAANSPLLALDRGFKDAVLFNLESRDIPGPPCWHLHVDHVLITPDARWMVTTTWKGQGIRVWDAKKCEFARDLARDVGSATPAFSRDGRWLAASDGFAYYLWEVGTWRLVYRIEREHPDGWPGPVAFSPDGRLLAVPHTRYIAQLIEVQSGRTVGVLEAPMSSSLSGYGFSADGRFLAVAETENIQLWDLNAIREQLKSMQIAWEVESHAR